MPERASDSAEWAAEIPTLAAAALATLGLDQYQLTVGSEPGVNVGVGTGIAITPEVGGTPEKLLQHLDLALSRAKGSGPNRFPFFETSVDQRFENHRHAELDLRKAFQVRQMELYYKPRVDVTTKILLGFKSFIRWLLHPARGRDFPEWRMAFLSSSRMHSALECVLPAPGKVLSDPSAAPEKVLLLLRRSRSAGLDRGLIGPAPGSRRGASGVGFVYNTSCGLNRQFESEVVQIGGCFRQLDIGREIAVLHEVYRLGREIHRDLRSGGNSSRNAGDLRTRLIQAAEGHA